MTDRTFKDTVEKSRLERMDREANRYAADLLMPFTLILKLKKQGLSLAEIAERLKVSVKVLEIRLER